MDVLDIYMLCIFKIRIILSLLSLIRLCIELEDQDLRTLMSSFLGYWLEYTSLNKMFWKLDVHTIASCIKMISV